MHNAYTAAIDTLRDTVVQRSHRYKWLVIVVSVGAIASAGVAVVLSRALPLLGGLALPALVAAFFALDLHAVQRWRRGVLQAWAAGELQLALLPPMLQKLPHLPAATVAGMLETLPTWPAQLPPARRDALLREQAMLAGIALQSLVVRAIAWALMAAAIVAAVLTGQAAWLLSAAGAPAVWIGWSLTSKWRLRHCPWTDDDAAALNWHGVPASFHR